MFIFFTMTSCICINWVFLKDEDFMGSVLWNSRVLPVNVPLPSRVTPVSTMRGCCYDPAAGLSAGHIWVTSGDRAGRCRSLRQIDFSPPPGGNPTDFLSEPNPPPEAAGGPRAPLRSAHESSVRALHPAGGSARPTPVQPVSNAWRHRIDQSRLPLPSLRAPTLWRCQSSK